MLVANYQILSHQKMNNQENTTGEELEERPTPSPVAPPPSLSSDATLEAGSRDREMAAFLNFGQGTNACGQNQSGYLSEGLPPALMSDQRFASRMAGGAGVPVSGMNAGTSWRGSGAGQSGVYYPNSGSNISYPSNSVHIMTQIPAPSHNTAATAPPINSLQNPNSSSTGPNETSTSSSGNIPFNLVPMPQPATYEITNALHMRLNEGLHISRQTTSSSGYDVHHRQTQAVVQAEQNAGLAHRQHSAPGAVGLASQQSTGQNTNLQPQRSAFQMTEFYTTLERSSNLTNLNATVPCQKLINNALIRRVNGSVYNNILGSSFSDPEEFKAHLNENFAMYFPDSATIFRSLLNVGCFRRFLRHHKQVTQFLPSEDENRNYYSSVERKLGIIVSMVEQNTYVQKHRSYQSGMHRHHSEPHSRNAAVLSEDMRDFYRNFPKGFFIAELQIKDKCYKTPKDPISTPDCEWQFTRTRYYSKYVPYRFSKYEPFKNDACTLQQLKEEFLKRRYRGIAKNDALCSFLPFVGQVVSFIKKSMNKATHRTDEADRVHYLFVQDNEKEFWKVPQEIPEELMHREEDSRAQPNGDVYEPGYAPSGTSMDFGATAAEINHASNLHMHRRQSHEFVDRRISQPATSTEPRQINSWRRPVRRNTYSGPEYQRGNMASQQFPHYASPGAGNTPGRGNDRSNY